MTPHRCCCLGLIAVLASLESPGLAGAADRRAPPFAAEEIADADRAGADGAETLFAPGLVPRLAITLTPADVECLRRDGRSNVRAVLVENGRTRYAGVQLHLKGTTSYRGIDDKPSFTLRFDDAPPAQRFHGLTKFHLNNSVEDPGYFNEYAGTLLFRAAGIPAPRVTHAVVWLNGRRFGLYVLKEGFAKEFLERHFTDGTGNLYDTGVGHDVDEALEKDAGTGPEDRSDLLALTAAALEPDLERRWERLGAVLDRDRFLDYLAMEILVCHRDGYAIARNNFRVYHDPGKGWMVFLPHGMDQLFGRPDATLVPVMQGLVARAVLETPEGRRGYRERLARHVRETLDVPRLRREARAMLERLRPALSRREWARIEREVASTVERAAQRRRWVEHALEQPEPTPLRFAGGRVPLRDWRAVDRPEGGTMDRRVGPGGRDALYICAGPRTSASWRAEVRLAKGQYRFRATLATRGVEALPFGNNHGAGIRAAGASPVLPYVRVGDHDATPTECEFELAAEGTVELICELRARAGEVWFVLDALELEWVR